MLDVCTVLDKRKKKEKEKKKKKEEISLVI